MHVRFTPESGHSEDGLQCPLSANSGHNDMSGYAATAGERGASRSLVLCGPGDEVRVRIAPATVACHHVRPAIFGRAILAVPMVTIFSYRAPGCLVGLINVKKALAKAPSTRDPKRT